jgi:hypothetical protein
MMEARTSITQRKAAKSVGYHDVRSIMLSYFTFPLALGYGPAIIEGHGNSCCQPVATPNLESDVLQRLNSTKSSWEIGRIDTDISD